MQTEEWKQLAEHQNTLRDVRISALFKNDLARGKTYTLALDEISFDYSRNKINERTIALLTALARRTGLEEMRAHLFNGAIMNFTERRPVLHMALRGSCPAHLDIEGRNVRERVDATLEQIRVFTEFFDNEQRFSEIVHIGIGGSDIGPKLAYSALRHLTKPGLRVHFLTNVDPDHFHDTLAGLNPARTLFIIASKSFSTQETMTNAHSAREWLVRGGVGADIIDAHFCAVTANAGEARQFGIAPENIFDLPDWVGGRFSLWSAVGLPVALALGFDHFKSLLHGAYTADQHFLHTPLEQNIPVMMGMLGVWYRNFWHYNAYCILPYAERLSLMPQYIQQLDMESNGKTMDAHAARVPYKTAPIVFGASGTGAQHTFFQLLHQGSEIVPCDFIATRQPVHPLGDHHEKLVANVLGQTKALMDGDHNADEPHKNFDGNRPSNILWLQKLCPQTLGMLLALYEHKIFVQGAVWNINSFDQYGVELGKTLADKALEKIQGVR